MDNSVVGGIAQEKIAESAELPSAAREILVPIGTMASGEPFIQDISVIPHFLICGFSGSGKTSFVQTVTALIATKYPPEKVKYIIYDSKKVDYTAYNAMPHLLVPVISDEKKAAGALSWVVAEIRGRLKQFSEHSAKDLATYNTNCKINGTDILPHIFLVLDDFSSLSLNGEVTSSLVDILKNGRPVGIHIILVTSLTSSKILTKEILSNVPCRISFCVSGRADSRIAIEQNGAEELHSPGELYFRWQSELIKCQGSYMSDEDIEKAIKQLQRQSRKSVSVLGTMAEQIFNVPVSPAVDDSDVNGERDPLFLDAVKIVVETGMASVSMIQRRLKLGYSRAARLIDQMEDKGIVGPFTGATPRKVLITSAQWQEIYSKESEESSKSAETTDEETPDIEMRNFPWFYFGEIGICVSDNQIRISKKVMTKYGPGTATPSFNGKSISGLTYRKPHMFSRGYIQFTLKPNVNIINPNSDLITVTRKDLPELLKIEFTSDVARTMKSFMIQISDDTGIRLVEL